MCLGAFNTAITKRHLDVTFLLCSAKRFRIVHQHIEYKLHPNISEKQQYNE